MKLRREIWWIAGLTVGMILLATVLGVGRHTRAEQVRFVPTTYTTSPSGARGLYLTLQALKYETRRYLRPFGGEMPEGGTIVILEPYALLLPTEWRALHRWVSEGNTLILAGRLVLPFSEGGGFLSFPTSDATATRQPRKKDKQESEPFPDLTFEEIPVAYAHPTQPTYLSQGVSRLATKLTSHIVIPEPEHKQKKEHFAPSFLQDAARPDEMEDALRAAAPAFADDEGTVVSYARVGKGRVVLLGSVWSLTNEGLPQADNLTFALNALGPASAGPVYFDEYHHGFREQVSWALLPLPLKVAVAQLLLAFFVLTYARSRRFGRIVPLERASRERSEFLGTMTALLRKGQATRLALRTARESAVHRLCQQLGLPAEAEDEEIALAAGRVNPKSQELLRAALARTRVALQGEVSETRAMALIRELDEAEQSLRQL
jgi:hypothetical protein